MFANTPSMPNSTDNQAWQWLWADAGSQIMSSLSAFSQNGDSSGASAGYYWGLCDPANPHRTLLLHPSSENKRQIGDLSLTMLGAGTLVIPRDGSNYLEYITKAKELVNATAKTIFHRSSDKK